jgi:hypothetical protein
MKIGKTSTIASILMGFIFVIIGLYYLLNLNRFRALDETYSELCMLFGVILALWGGVMVLFGSIQYWELKKGKEFEVPDKLVMLMILNKAIKMDS